VSFEHDVAVVGAGVSGATATRILNQHGVPVDCYEKSRGSGGRAATRRVTTEHDLSFHFDHGAQYFTVRDPNFRQFVEEKRERGRIHEWNPELGVAEDGSVCGKKADTDRYVATPGMSSLAGMLMGDTDPETGCRIDELTRVDEGIQLRTDEGITGPYDAVVLTAPPEQSANMVKPISERLAEHCRRVEIRPVWTVLLGFESTIPVQYDAVFVNDGALDWVARNSSKPGRPDTESWVLHSTSGWAEGHLEIEQRRVIEILSREFADWFDGGNGLEPIYSSAHRWRYARAANPEDAGLLHDEDRTVFVAGDWLWGNRVEGAFMSGRPSWSF
jgi:renalase